MTTWAMILASMLAVSFALALPFYVRGRRKVVDKSLLLITPIALLVAEDYPRWFTAKRDERVKKRKRFNSISGNFILLTWCLMGSIVAYAFQSNLRAMYIKKEPPKQIDTALDVLEQNKQLHIQDSGLQEYFIYENDNELLRRLAQTAKLYPYENLVDIINSLMSTGSDDVVMASNREAENIFFSFGLKLPRVYYSKEEVFPPFYRVWMLERLSPWRESIDMHLYLLRQVRGNNPNFLYHFNIVVCHKIAWLFVFSKNLNQGNTIIHLFLLFHHFHYF